MKQLARWMLAVEPLLLLMMLVIMWGPDYSRVSSLYLLVPVIIVRLLVYRRLAPASPVNAAMIALLLLGIINLYIAPYRPLAAVLGRPIMGVLVVVSFADRARRKGENGFDALLTASVILGLAMALTALFWSQWTTKSTIFEGILALIPSRPALPGLQDLFGGGFNVNEIGGALAWMCPLLAGIAIFDYRRKRYPVRLVAAMSGFVLLAITLMLGQSRAAILGTLLALTVVSVGMIRRVSWRAIALAGIGAVAVFELLLVAGVISPGTGLQSRDEDSLSTRVDIWTAALHAIEDHPLTGLGMNKFRAREVRVVYPVPSFASPVLPHTHNEWLQIGTDLGVPGIIVYTGLYGTVVWVLWRAFRRGHHLAIAIGAGLLAHAVFGLVDAITLFDRFIFVLWWLIGLAVSIEIISRETQDNRSILEIESELSHGTPHRTEVVP